MQDFTAQQIKDYILEEKADINFSCNQEQKIERLNDVIDQLKLWHYEYRNSLFRLEIQKEIIALEIQVEEIKEGIEREEEENRKELENLKEDYKSNLL